MAVVILLPCMAKRHVPEIAIFFMTRVTWAHARSKTDRDNKYQLCELPVALAIVNRGFSESRTGSGPVHNCHTRHTPIMPPIRTKHSQNADSPIAKQGPKKRRSQAKPKEEAAPGVSKIKSALRQTRRLLAKVRTSGSATFVGSYTRSPRSRRASELMCASRQSGG